MSSVVCKFYHIQDMDALRPFEMSLILIFFSMFWSKTYPSLLYL